MGAEEFPGVFSRRITGEDSIPGCSDLIRVRFVVLDYKARIPSLMPLVTCMLRSCLSGRAFFFTERQEDLARQWDSDSYHCVFPGCAGNVGPKAGH